MLAFLYYYLLPYLSRRYTAGIVSNSKAPMALATCILLALITNYYHREFVLRSRKNLTETQGIEIFATLSIMMITFLCTLSELFIVYTRSNDKILAVP